MTLTGLGVLTEKYFKIVGLLNRCLAIPHKPSGSEKTPPVPQRNWLVDENPDHNPTVKLPVSCCLMAYLEMAALFKSRLPRSATCNAFWGTFALKNPPGMPNLNREVIPGPAETLLRSQPSSHNVKDLMVGSGSGSGNRLRHRTHETWFGTTYTLQLSFKENDSSPFPCAEWRLFFFPCAENVKQCKQGWKSVIRIIPKNYGLFMVFPIATQNWPLAPMKLTGIGSL